NAVEQNLATLWSGLLGVADVGVFDDFFELGGHSLIAVRLLSKIKKTFGVDLALESLYRAPTIAAFAQLVADDLGIALTPPEADRPLTDEPATKPATLPVFDAAPGPAPAASTGTAVPRAGWSPLVPIQVKGSRAPFFCVHGA